MDTLFNLLSFFPSLKAIHLQINPLTHWYASCGTLFILLKLWILILAEFCLLCLGSYSWVGVSIEMDALPTLSVSDHLYRFFKYKPPHPTCTISLSYVYASAHQWHSMLMLSLPCMGSETLRWAFSSYWNDSSWHLNSYRHLLRLLWVWTPHTKLTM